MALPSLWGLMPYIYYYTRCLFMRRNLKMPRGVYGEVIHEVIFGVWGDRWNSLVTADEPSGQARTRVRGSGGRLAGLPRGAARRALRERAQHGQEHAHGRVYTQVTELCSLGPGPHPNGPETGVQRYASPGFGC